MNEKNPDSPHFKPKAQEPQAGIYWLMPVSSVQVSLMLYRVNKT
jgi:hypothetical protein